MFDVGIFVESRRRFFTEHYFIHRLMEEWAGYGLSITATEDLADLAKVRLAVLHYDRTRLPDAVGRAVAAKVPVVNGRLLDISKRKISRSLVTPGDGYSGPVIVKTDLNCGGYPELEAMRGRSVLRRPAVWALRRLPWMLTGYLDPGAYRVYQSVDQVPWLVRRNDRLVMEKFQPERVGELYCLRQYLFFGDAELNTMLLGPRPIVKGHDVVLRQEVPEIPAGLRTLRLALGADFGRFDYVMQGGSVVLFDVNKTPGYSASRFMVPFRRMAETLAPGIWSFLDRDGTGTGRMDRSASA